VLLEYVVMEVERSPARFQLTLNRRPVSSFSSELAAINTARALAAAHALAEAVIVSVRRLNGDVQVIESSLARAASVVDPSATSR
jgi:hypothetical protein